MSNTTVHIHILNVFTLIVTHTLHSLCTPHYRYCVCEVILCLTDYLNATLNGVSNLCFCICKMHLLLRNFATDLLMGDKQLDMLQMPPVSFLLTRLSCDFPAKVNNPSRTAGRISLLHALTGAPLSMVLHWKASQGGGVGWGGGDVRLMLQPDRTWTLEEEKILLPANTWDILQIRLRAH